MWADSESKVDYLNYSEVSDMICDLVSDDSMLPISLGVYGTWGVGKSSILQLVGAELRAEERNLVVPFDAWLYQDFEEAKSALMTVIAKAIYEAAPETLQEKAAGFYRRVNKLKFLGMAADVGALLAGVPTLGLFTKAAGSAEEIWEGTADEEDLNNLKGAATEASNRASGLLRPKEKRNAPEEIIAFRNEFSQLLDDMGRRLVVFVDNLDRCLPENAIATLEAMRLFLFMPNTVFVVAADEDMIRLSVEKHFKDPGSQHITDYLDKLIQIPLRVPKLGLQEVRAYLFMLAAARSDVTPDKVEDLRAFLIGKLRKSWSDEPPFDVNQAAIHLGISSTHELRGTLETMDRLAGLLAHSKQVNGNPRIVKRLLNVVRMRSLVARRRGMALDEATIAKLALFERCTDESAIRALNALISAAPDGKASQFVELEALGDGVAPDNLPKEWQKYPDFVLDWLKLHPPLGGTDLRPAVYLSKETMPVKMSPQRISAKTLKAIEVILKTATLSSVASKTAIREIDAAEVGDAMDEIIAMMKRNPDWSRIRDDFRGASLLAKSDEIAHEKLVAFIESLPSRPRWMKTLMKGETTTSTGSAT